MFTRHLLVRTCSTLAVAVLLGAAPVFANDLVCEVELSEGSATPRTVHELELATRYVDPDAFLIWNQLFGVTPGTSATEHVTIAGSQNLLVTWPEGQLDMGGAMRVRIKTDRLTGLKDVKIEMPSANDGATLFIGGTGAVNPNIADGGWHEVEVENLGNVTVTFDGQVITGTLKKLEVELSPRSTTTNPVVKEFEIEISGATTAPDVKKGIVNAVSVFVPRSVVRVHPGTEFEEERSHESGGEARTIEAEFERESHATVEGVDASPLLDGANNLLHERVGACIVTPDRPVGND